MRAKQRLLFAHEKKQNNFFSIGEYELSTAPPLQGGETFFFLKENASFLNLGGQT